MRLYGEANKVPGLATGPIETRFNRLRQHAGAGEVVVWTTPGRWAAGEGLSLRMPALRLEFVCALEDGHLEATKITQVPDDARPPDRESGAVGALLRAEHVALPPEDTLNGATPDDGVAMLERHFARLAGRRWGGFVEPLRAALEAEAREDEARTQRLTVPFREASLVRSGEEDVWKFANVPAEALRAFDDGEWLEVLDDQGRSRTTARVIDTHPGQGTMEVGVRAASDPPKSGFLRPRSRRKILDQKRALLDELASPTGSLPHLVRLVAAPASVPAPRSVRPSHMVNAAVGRNRSQARAVALALGLEDGQAIMIQGPPGTGKSTTAAEIDVQLILRDPGVRVLVCSHSNHGTDNMLMKVLPFLEDAQERIARVGFYERVAKEARPYFAAPDADLGEKNIVFTTIDALALQDIAGARVYDYVLLDEANRAGVLDSLLALARGRRMVMVGDPMQLQPVMSEAEQQMVSAGSGKRKRGRAIIAPAPGAANVIGKSLFAWLQERHFNQQATVLLDQQNRMHPAIGELVSRVFYSGRVKTGPAAPRRGTGVPAFPSAATWVDTRSLRGNVESRAGGTSIFNVAEARLVTTITRHLASQAPPNLSIGVITAYAEQRDLLRRLMGPHDWPADRQLEIDTVDAFEGREKDIIVLSLVRSNRRKDIGFLRLEQRLNVAVSRARRMLIIVGDTSTLRAGYFHHLVATASSVGQIVGAPKLLANLTRGGRRGRRDRQRRRDERGVEGVAPNAEQAGEVQPSAAPDQEGEGVAPGESRRRRRRRLWERRRERLRALREERHGEPGGEPPPDAAPVSGSEGKPTAVEQMPTEPRARRRRAPGRLPVADVAEAEAAVAAAPPEEGPALAKPRRRSRAPAAPAPAVVPGAPMAEEPVAKPRRTTRRTVSADADTPAEVPRPPATNGFVAPEDQPTARRAPRRRLAPAASAPAEPATVVATDAAPAARRRRSPADQAPPPAEVADQPRPRRTRKKPAPDADSS